MRFSTCLEPRRAMIFAALLAGLFGCSEGEEEIPSARAAAEAERAAQSLAADEWLNVDEGVPPALFLAQATGADAAELAAPLEKLAARYRESPRMIVNRLIQLWRAARDDDPELTPLRLVEDFTPEDRDAARPLESLGPVAQHYLVARGQGLDHEAALAAAFGRGAP